MIVQSREQGWESILVLSHAFNPEIRMAWKPQPSFFSSAHSFAIQAVKVNKQWRQTLEEKVFDSVVSIQMRHHPSHRGYGMKITTDGFIVTPFHVIENYLHTWQVMAKSSAAQAQAPSQDYTVLTRNSIRYQLDLTVWAYDSTHGIALVKALIPAEPEPVLFNPASGDLSTSKKVMLIGLRDQQPYIEYGEVTRTSANIRFDSKPMLDALITSAKGFPLCSGTPVFAMDGALAALTLGHFGGETACVKAKYVLELVKTAAAELHRAVVIQPSHTVKVFNLPYLEN